MCDGYYSKCSPIGCASGAATLGCLQVGNKCLGCGRALLTINKPLNSTPDANGNIPAAPDETTGKLLDGDSSDVIGWEITQVGAATGLQVGDIVTSINSLVPDAAFFEMLALMEGRPVTFNLQLRRAGNSMSLSFSRA